MERFTTLFTRFILLAERMRRLYRERIENKKLDSIDSERKAE